MCRLLGIAALLALAASAPAQTYIASDVTASTTWTAAGSPYVIQADVDVLDNSVLTIQAGVTVAFDGAYIFETVDGSAIVAAGTEADPILFTSNAPTPAPGDWRWLQVHGGTPSSFTHCIFEYGEYGLRPNSAAPTISHCTVRHCSSSGIFVAGASPVITHCDIHHCRDGIAVSHNSSAPTVNFCNIHDNTHWNVYVMAFAAPLVVIDMENNWWGTADPEAIAQEINDSLDHADLYATIDFEPWAGAVPAASLSWSGLKALFGR
jgi:hypothetical protein